MKDSIIMDPKSEPLSADSVSFRLPSITLTSESIQMTNVEKESQKPTLEKIGSRRGAGVVSMLFSMLCVVVGVECKESQAGLLLLGSRLHRYS